MSCLDSLFNYIVNFLSPSNPPKDAFRTVQELVESRGFSFEEHQVTTKDGYILTLHRLFHPTNNNDQANPVLIGHGLCHQSIYWLIHSEENLLKRNETSNSLAFALAKEGYDVWLCNFRGTVHSKGHLTLSSWNSKFWDFSLTELIATDMPTMVDLVLSKTAAAKLHYVGYSLGSAVMFALLSTRPSYASKMISFTSLSPAMALKNPPLPFYLLCKSAELIGFLDGTMMSSSIVKFFTFWRPFQWAAFKFFDLTLGKDEDQNNYLIQAELTAQGFGDVSLKLLRHLGQIMTHEAMDYDYGEAKNLQVYGSKRPPLYKLSKITLPNVNIIASRNDPMLRLNELRFIVNQLTQVKNLKVRIVKDELFCHSNFIYGKDVGKLVNCDVLSLIKEANYEVPNEKK